MAPKALASVLQSGETGTFGRSIGIRGLQGDETAEGRECLREVAGLSPFLDRLSFERLLLLVTVDDGDLELAFLLVRGGDGNSFPGRDGSFGLGLEGSPLDGELSSFSFSSPPLSSTFASTSSMVMVDGRVDLTGWSSNRFLLGEQ